MVTVRSGGNAYQDQKAMKKPNHEKNQTRPYIFTGFKAGILRALLFTGLTSGAWKRSIGLYILFDISVAQRRTGCCRICSIGTICLLKMMRQGGKQRFEAQEELLYSSELVTIWSGVTR